ERDVVLYHAYAGEAFLGMGELDAAAEHGHRALDLLGQNISSDRASSYVSQLAEQLRTHQPSHAARSLLERVAHHAVQG
ncbi:MAG: hypothetical protein ACRDQ5_05200, partial [Sciscionella sp.]